MSRRLSGCRFGIGLMPVSVRSGCREGRWRMYHLSIVLRREDGTILAAEDVDCDTIGHVLAELADGCLAMRRFRDELDAAFDRGVESRRREHPPVLRTYEVGDGKAS